MPTCGLMRQWKQRRGRKTTVRSLANEGPVGLVELIFGAQPSAEIGGFPVSLAGELGILHQRLKFRDCLRGINLARPAKTGRSNAARTGAKSLLSRKSRGPRFPCTSKKANIGTCSVTNTTPPATPAAIPATWKAGAKRRQPAVGCPQGERSMATSSNPTVAWPSAKSEVPVSK